MSALFAGDVKVFENGRLVADGVSAWIKLEKMEIGRLQRRVIGFSEGGGDLLLVDMIDTVDRTNLPPTFIADPRWKTRATLYQFGPDHLIHLVRLSAVEGIWEIPHHPQ